MNQHTLLPKKTERLQYFGSVSPIKGEKPVEKEKMKDLQNIRKDYFFDIQHVGVANVSHPVTITSAMMPAEQTTAANFTMTCNLPRNQKGINMSRLTELLQVYHQNGWILSFSSLQQFTKELAENMDTSPASVEVRFPWFFERKSPKLEKAGLMHADIFMSVTYRKDQPFKQRAGISAKVTTLCPCSKEISEYSAHNQRGTVSIWADIHPAASLLICLSLNGCRPLRLNAAMKNRSISTMPMRSCVFRRKWIKYETLIIHYCSSYASLPAVNLLRTCRRTRKYQYKENSRKHNGRSKNSKNKH